MKNIESKKAILIIDDEKNMLHMLSNLLKKQDYLIDTVSNGLEGLDFISKKEYDFILCDIKMPNMNGLDFLKIAQDRFKESLENTAIIMMSAYGNTDTAIEAMKMGAYDYISKPFKSDEIYLVLKKAWERENLKRENLKLKEQIKIIEQNHSFGNLIGKSKLMENIFNLAKKLVDYDMTVLIIGENGTGKELIAKAIHFESKRAKEVFIPVNCGAVPENLLETEFFGYKKGAFTGADKDKKGLFEEAENGTIFLDEIGEISPSLQVSLLRVLQEKEIRLIGDSKVKKINARIIAATSKNLELEVKNGKFRQDLFYRLNILPIKLPALRERLEDVPLLANYFVKKFNKLFGKNIKEIAPNAMQKLLNYNWPGNVRELENAIERAIILADSFILSVDNFENLKNSSNLNNLDNLDNFFDNYSLKDMQKKLEKVLILKALEKSHRNKTKASEILEISYPALLNKIKIYEINV